MPVADSLVDTNILLYAVSDNSAEREKAQIARAILQRPDIGFSTQVFGEFFHQTTRARARTIPSDRAMRIIQRLAKRPVQPVTLEVVAKAIGLHARFSLSYWDAAILAAASELGCATVWSEDMAHNQNYGGVTVVNPFLDPVR